MFSRRTSGPREPNPLTRAIAEARARFDLWDLTESNPTRVQLPMDRAAVAAALAKGAEADYVPAPLGADLAREAVADYYSRRGVAVDPARVMLTATTSEAYAYLFRLLADPGEEVVAATPSYPLFGALAEAAEVKLSPHAMLYDGRWRLDPTALAAALSPRTRALLTVGPNNPTGSCLGPVDRRRLVQAALTRGAAVISDEVFLDYLDAPERFAATSFAREAETLTFTLSGLSKVAALPHLKLSWVVVNGPPEQAAEAMDRLEHMADTFLSVGTPVQEALPRLLEQAEETQDFLRGRLWENGDHLRDVARRAGLTVRARDGGWYAVLDLPDGWDDEAFALELVTRAQVVVQPGYLFDLEDRPAVVLSLLPAPEVFQEGVDRLISLALPGPGPKDG
ncbi:MAG: pyridoxal phosphate-dependent aminotransferase [Deltaproteobacteria bacterium]|nr:pyridoxal phosphate-dependent aminotransferase [Deltaproteobacteria bacterium]